MLADELCQHGIHMLSRKTSVLKKIAAAEKYDLSPPFAATADALSEQFGSLTKAFPFCRLPYENTWIEVIHKDRPHFAAATMHAPKLQRSPKRVGFLLTATRKDLSAWKAHLFWNIPEPDSIDLGPMYYGAAGVAMAFDMTDEIASGYSSEDEWRELNEQRRRRYDPALFGDVKQHRAWQAASLEVKNAMFKHTRPITADYPPPGAVELLLAGGGPNEYELMMQLACSDWAGEAAFLLAVIGLMNARNATEQATSDFTKLNRSRAKNGKTPLFTHRVLKIHTHQQKKVAATPGDHTYAHLRGHFVAGHWKVRKTGIFFWKPFSRGDFSKGMITKDYQLT